MRGFFREFFGDPELRITKEDVVHGVALLLFVVAMYYVTVFFLYICGVL